LSTEFVLGVLVGDNVVVNMDIRLGPEIVLSGRIHRRRRQDGVYTIFPVVGAAGESSGLGRRWDGVDLAP
jgi:hypothetical protein